MKTKTLLQFRKGILTKFALIALLLTGGAGAAVADTVVVDGNTIADGWTNGGATKFTASTGSVTSVSQAFSTTTDGQLSPVNGYTWYSIVSDYVIAFPKDGSIEISVKSFNNYGGELIVRYSADKSEWTNAADITTELRSNDAMAAFSTQTINNIPEGDCYLQIIGKAININSVVIKGEAAAVTTPVLAVSPKSIAFGSLRDNATETVTVKNTGVGSMDVTIASDNTTDFTLSTTELTGIGAGESKTFTVTFNYNAESIGEKTVNITVTPSYATTAATTVTATAIAANANVWEDFSEGIPATWYNENGSWLNYVTNMEGMASPGYNSSHILRTPRLYAEAGEALGFDVKIVGKYSSNKVTASYSTDRVNWSNAVDYTTDGTYAIVAPETGYYWVRFTASQAGIDNMTGWTIAPIAHETILGTATIPAKGTAHGTYTAKVDVMELGGSEEAITAALYFGDEKVAEQAITLSGNRDETITLSYLPTEEFSGDVFITVSGENIGTLETDKVAVEITETTYVFDEDSAENPVISTASVVKVKYTAQKGWNTIVMPFSLSGSPEYMNAIFGEGWTAHAIESCENGTLNFTKPQTYMATSTPFLVYAPNAEAHPDGVYLQSVSAGSYNWNHSNITKTVGDATFKGTFAPIAAPALEGKYVMAAYGTFAQLDATASIKAYHAYIEMAEGATLQTITIDGNDIEGITTDLSFVKLLPGTNHDVYTLSGQKVQRAQKGIYIVNGRKVVIK